MREVSTETPDSTIGPFVGYIETTLDAMRVAVAARRVVFRRRRNSCVLRLVSRKGICPRVTRRMNDLERKTLVNSGAVFIFCVEESNIQRWTDGINWSASRVVRNFLVCHLLCLELGLTSFTRNLGTCRSIGRSPWHETLARPLQPPPREVSAKGDKKRRGAWDR